MDIKKYLFEHPVASVFLAWTGADVIRMGVNTIRDVIHCKHIEKVNEQKINGGWGPETLSYGCETSDENKTEKTEQTEEVKAIEEGS